MAFTDDFEGVRHLHGFKRDGGDFEGVPWLPAGAMDASSSRVRIRTTRGASSGPWAPDRPPRTGMIPGPADGAGKRSLARLILGASMRASLWVSRRGPTRAWAHRPRRVHLPAGEAPDDKFTRTKPLASSQRWHLRPFWRPRTHASPPPVPLATIEPPPLAPRADSAQRNFPV